MTIQVNDISILSFSAQFWCQLKKAAHQRNVHSSDWAFNKNRFIQKPIFMIHSNVTMKRHGWVRKKNEQRAERLRFMTTHDALVKLKSVVFTGRENCILNYSRADVFSEIHHFCSLCLHTAFTHSWLAFNAFCLLNTRAIISAAFFLILVCILSSTSRSSWLTFSQWTFSLIVFIQYTRTRGRARSCIHIKAF